MSIEVSGIFGLILFIINIYAIVKTIQSYLFGLVWSGSHKIMWILLILLLPVIGVALWFFLGPRVRH